MFWTDERETLLEEDREGGNEDEGEEGNGEDEADDLSNLIISKPFGGRKIGSKDDYHMLGTLGRGGFGTVWRVGEYSTRTELAMKECSKHRLRQDKVEHLIMRERAVHARMFHKNIIPLLKSFQDKDYLYFIMPLMKSTLAYEFGRRGQFRNESTRFYSAQLILALEYMAEVGVVHNDIKLQNMLLDDRMHLKLCDFGCAVFVEKEVEHASRRQLWRQERPNIHHRVGTPCYFAPEVITQGPVSLGTDLWMLGCMLYECHTGDRPFEPWEDLKKMIPNCEYQEFPDSVDPALKHLVQNLLVKDPTRRLGYKNFAQLKMHPFYGTRDPASWEQLEQVEAPPFSSRDPRARSESQDRPAYNVFFQPSTDRLPVYHQPDPALYDGFDGIPAEEDHGLCGRFCPPKCTVM